MVPEPSAQVAPGPAAEPAPVQLTHLVWGMAGAAVVLLGGIAPGWLARGAAGVAGVCAGVAVVTASHMLSGIVVAWADRVNRPLIMPLGMATYVVKFTLIGLLMWALASARWPGLVPMGITVIATAVAWSGAQVLWLVRTQFPYRSR